MATATQNGFSKTSGFVEQVKRNEGRTALKIDDKWFSTFGTCKVEQGDKIELTYVVKEKGDRVYRNIKNIEPINPVTATTTPTGNAPTDKDSAIARSVALKSAVAWVHSSASLDDVLDTAAAFLTWLQDGHTPTAAGPDVGDGDNVPF